ncbi:unnamed protein product [Ilex paraguariensis]|uniref:Pentatricopeptide repeat-containing protein n=1 Tax=Ilex paraguariensis TaxID=185542 RepID=A0ABC8UXZ9_9AQUA
MLRQLNKLPLPFAISFHSIRSYITTSTSEYSHNNLAVENEERTYSHMLQKCVETSDLHSGKSVQAKLIKEALLHSLYLQNHLLNMYVKCGDLVNGVQLFDEMPQRNVVSWTALIAGFVQMGFPVEALSLFYRMHQTGVKPNEFTFVSALQACSLSDNITSAYQIYALIVQLGFESNIFLVNAFLTALIRHCKLDEALEIFEKCLNKDTVSWNAMMAGYLQFSYSDVPGFWCRMICEGMKPDGFTFASVLTGLAELNYLKLGMQVHSRLVKSGYGSEMCVGNSLVDMYLKNQNLIDGFKAFQEIPSKDVPSWTQMAVGCLNCGEPSKALWVIGEMRRIGVKPNKFTLATSLNACANLASLEEGQKFHSLRIKLENDVDVCVDNALLDMYAKCGCVDSALGVFQSMDDRSVVSWTTMILAYAQNGNAGKALEIFNEMKQEGEQPNDITFVCVLYACSQGGFIDEGRKYFSSMTSDHGVFPGEDHYACMVNLLGRAGYIKEAEELILGMPFQPGVLVWQTLLGACQLHGIMETAKRAAENALLLDKEDPSTYLLLSNMFASSSNWDGVRMLRKLMENGDVKKMSGSSWIEVNGDHSLQAHRKFT